MPTRSLTPVDNFNTISIWLNQNLSTPGITPISSQLINIPRVPGLYFWFLKAKGYSVLSNEISGIERVSKSIIYSNKDQDLVYVGSAGTGKNKGGHLRQRLQWHISQKHSTNAICSKAISSFRAGISALISNDLILFPGSTTELEVDRILEEYFHVLWIPYESIDFIDNDENILIGNLRPLLNCNKNPNALNNALPNPTKTYKKRRNLIRKNTKARLGCITQKSKNKQKVQIPHKISRTPSTVFTNQDCIEFNVPKHKSIQDVIVGRTDLPTGKCRFLIQNAADRNQLIYESSRNMGWRITGNGGQNIYTFLPLLIQIEKMLSNGKSYKMK